MEITLEDTVIEAKGHAWNEGEITVEATCATPGEMTYTCTTCEDTLVVETELDPENHEDLAYMEWQDPACEEDGHTDYMYCAACGRYFTEDGEEIDAADTVLAATGHKWDEGKPTDDGGIVYTCTVCEQTKTETDESGTGVLDAPTGSLLLLRVAVA